MVIGFFFALLIGLSLGLLGGGGSILTVPVLIYVMHMEPKTAIALSLAIVGLTSLIGIYGHYKNENIEFKTAAVFAPFAMSGTFIGAKLSQFFSAEAQLMLFAAVMILASGFMLKKPKYEANEENKKLNIPVLGTQGILVGILTGLVGVGGGFLIVPALVLLAKVPMKKAIGTSLLIIALNSLSGFIGYINLVEIPWVFLFQFSLFSGAGIIIGSKLVKFISQDKLKKLFAVFLIVMGIFVIYKNY